MYRSVNGRYVVRLLAGSDALSRLGWLDGRVNLRTVFVMRFMLPLTAIGIDFVSYAAGLKELRFWRYYLASIVPWTVLSVVYFTSTRLLRDRSLVWFFVPAAVLILVPGAVLAGRWAPASLAAD